MDKRDYEIRVDTERLKAARKRAKITQAEAADKLGISMGAYKSKEAGETSFKDSEKLMLFDLFHMTYDEFDEILFGGKLEEMRMEIDEKQCIGPETSESEAQDDLVFLLVPVSKKKIGFPDFDNIIPLIRGSSNAE